MSKPLSIVFCGTSLFALPSLKKLCEDDSFAVNLVISQPARPTGRKQELMDPPVAAYAKEQGIPLFQPESLNKEWKTHKEILTSANFLVVVSFGQLLSQEILDLPRIAPVNIHASLLPLWRGASPLQSTILNGDTDTGVTIQKMIKELDAGPVLSVFKTTVAKDETAITLHDRLAVAGADLLTETLKAPLKPVEQDASKATFCKKFTKEDGLVDVTTMNATEIDRKVRAFQPWPGVTVNIDGEAVKILKASVQETANAYPLLCKDNTTLYVQTVKPAGKKEMPAADWMRGKRFS